MLKLGMIRVCLVEEFPELAGIWLSTISKCLRSDLGLSFKRLEQTMAPTFRPEAIRKVFETAYFHVRLRGDQTETFFFDEFKVNTRQHSLKGWTQRGWKSYVKASKGSFSMTFVWALSQFKIYGLLGNLNSNTASVACHYISSLLSFRNADLNFKRKAFTLVCDNALIHVW